MSAGIGRCDFIPPPMARAGFATGSSSAAPLSAFRFPAQPVESAFKFPPAPDATMSVDAELEAIEEDSAEEVDEEDDDDAGSMKALVPDSDDEEDWERAEQGDESDDDDDDSSRDVSGYTH